MRKTCRNCKHSNYTPENFAEVTKACGFCGIYLANWDPKEDVPDMNVGNMDPSRESNTEITRCSDDTISRQAALDAFNVDMSGVSVTISGRGAGKVYGYVKTVTDRIKALPPVQPNHNAEVSKMEIVHCKDCKRQDTNNAFRSMWCHEIRTFVKPDEFCCWAEKRGEAE